MNIGQLLGRMGYRGPLVPGLETLRSLQHAFLLTVPFENLDIHLGRKIVLAPERIFEKIVTMRRGGVCYERNLLFKELLTDLGFRVDILSARMVRGSDVGPEFDHMALMVELDHQYLLDVGNGHFCREPLRMDGSDQSEAEGHVYKVGPCNGARVLFYRRASADWHPRFLFTLKPRLPVEFEEMNIFHQSSADSPFTRRRMVSMANEEGRVSLIDMKLIHASNGAKRMKELSSEQEYLLCLRQNFGIELP